MPLLGRVFGKREKSSTNLGVPESSPARKYSIGSSKSSDYVLPDLNTPPDVNGSEVGHRTPSPSKQGAVYTNSKGSASGSRMKLAMSGFKRKATSPDPTSPRSSSSVRDSLEPPPSRTSVFTAFGRSGSSQSLPSDSLKSRYGAPQLPPMDLPEDFLFKRPPPITSQTLPVPKTPEMRTSNTVKIFNWGSKPTRMSDAPKLDLQILSSSQDPLDSFSLKSFRPVRPASPSPSNALDLQLPSPFMEQPRSQSPANLAPPSPIGDPRPRGSSMGSDTSQRITVAQFRQAQLESAKNRSSVHLPVPEHPSDSMPPGNVPLHMSLARPVSPSFALAAVQSANSANASGNESAGEANAAPSRPGRLLPPQAMGRSSPIPRERTPVSSSPMQRPQSGNRPQEGARMSAKWMVDSDSDANSSEGTASDDASRWASKKPPLIGDFRKLKGANSPKPDASSSTSPYPSSFSPSKSRTVMSASKSDLGHGSSSTARHHAAPASPASLSISSPIRPSSSFTSSPSPVHNIKPGQYSGGGSPAPQGGGSSPSQYGRNVLPGSPAQRSPSVMTHATGESVDAWSNTHSAAHSRQGSYDQLFKQGGAKGMAKSDLGHDGSMIKRSAGVRRTGTGSKSLAVPNAKSPPTRSQSANVITQPTPSSFYSKAASRTAVPVATDTEDEEEPPSSTEDDHPLASLVPPRRPGSGLSSQGSGSPVNSSVALPLRDQSPGARSTATHKSRSSLGNMAVPTSRSMTMPERRNGSASPNSSSKEPTLDPKSPLSRGRKPLINLATSSPTVVENSQKPPPAAVSYAGPQQGSLLTPPISEQGFSSSSLAETARHQSPPATSSSLLRPGPSAIQRNHEHLTRPFARDDSPASSVGNSSIGSGRFPATPRTGSDTGLSAGKTQSIVTSSSGSSGNNDKAPNGGKRTSITFNDTVVFTQKKGLHRRGPSGDSAGSAARNSYDEQDEKRNVRRRNEAKAAVELGCVVNGPAPVDSDDDAQEDVGLMPNNQNQQQNWNPWQNMGQNPQMQAMAMNLVPPTPGLPPMNMNMGMGNPMFNPLMSQMPQMNMGGMMGSQQMFNPVMQTGMGMQPGMGMQMGFNLPPIPSMPNMMMGVDPSMMAAHQQAMAMAKQAYQMAVAQQAIAAAGDEWERSSNMGGYGGASRPPTLFGGPSGSVYGGGSLLGIPTGGSVWGGSVYGDAFGPSQQHHGRQMGPMGGGGQYASSALGIDDPQSRGQSRKRTNTAPSSALPPAHLRGAGAPPMPPPSSWRPS